jgi:hypothetical protein
MKKALLPALSLAACLVAAGCTDSDWNHVLNYGGLGEKDAASVDEVPTPPAEAQAATDAQAATAAPAAAAAAEPSNADFCRNVATQDATRNDFDQATQQRVFQRSYAQCVAIYTR